MSRAVIDVENLGKKYVIQHRPRYLFSGESFRDVLVAEIKRLPARIGGYFSTGTNHTSGREDFWALRQVNFRLDEGDRLAIIGKNGAGKSTLLKLLSRITEPSEGRFRLRGRVASLLEVGTGFHMELSGRENIFLNGAVLGMTRQEILRKFDEIVAFAEVEKFLDTPVKRYSSGMYLRLAFAIAAHLNPEILIIDEVLAVGDIAFQKKCLGKMEDVSREGRTILFVSHNMGAVMALTNRAIWLENGQSHMQGDTRNVVTRYIEDSLSNCPEWFSGMETAHPVQVTAISLLQDDGTTSSIIGVDKSFELCIDYTVRVRVPNVVIIMNLYSIDGSHLINAEDADGFPEFYISRNPGRYRTRVKIPGNLLNTGSYYVQILSGVTGYDSYDNISAIQFSIVETRRDFSRDHRGGYIQPHLPWSLESL